MFEFDFPGPIVASRNNDVGVIDTFVHSVSWRHRCHIRRVDYTKETGPVVKNFAKSLRLTRSRSLNYTDDVRRV